MKANSKGFCLFLFSFCIVTLCFSQSIPVKNWDFEKEHNGWAADWYQRAFYENIDDVSYHFETGDAHSGTHYVTISNDHENDSRLYQFVDVKPWTVYRISVWIRVNQLEGDAGASIGVLDSYARSPDIRYVSPLWEQVSFFGFTGQYQSRLLVGLRFGYYGGVVKGSASFDDVEIIQVKEPVPAEIQSVSMSDPYDQQKVDDYFNRVADARFTDQGLSLSIFMAVLLAFMAGCYVVYIRFIRDKLPKPDAFIKIAFTRFYYIFIVLFFLIFTIAFIIWPDVNKLDVQVFFAVVLTGACLTAFYLFRIKALTMQSITILVIILGIAIRLCFFMYTSPTSGRQPDVGSEWSHLSYISHIVETWTLPPVGIYEAHQPPVHYILCAIVYKLADLCKVSVDLFRIVEIFIVFLSTLCLVFVYKIFKLLKCDGKVMLFGTAFICFLPQLVYFSVYLNNDLTSMLFILISLYYLLKWVDKKTMKNAILLAVFAAISALTKRFALAFYAVAGIVFFVELIRNRQEWKKYLVQGAVFLAIAVPLGLSYQLRNYILFQQDLSYYVPPFSYILPANPFNLFFVDIKNLLEQPISSRPGIGRNFFFMELIRTTLFSISEYPGLDDIAVVLMFFFIIILILFIAYFLFLRKDDKKNLNYVLIVNMLIVFAMYLNMRNLGPYDCIYNIRYTLPSTAISVAYFIGLAIPRFSNTKYPVLNFVVQAQFWVWCATSILFVLMMGF